MKKLIFPLVVMMFIAMNISAQTDTTKGVVSTEVVTRVFAQDQSPDLGDNMKFFPPSITWDMYPGGGTGVKLTLKKPTELGRLHDAKYWVKPAEDKMSLDMYMTSPVEHGYKKSYNHTEFLAQMLQNGYRLCPVWLPPQAYLVTADQDALVVFVANEEDMVVDGKGKRCFYAIGPNNGKTDDLFLVPVSKVGHQTKQVFVKYHQAHLEGD